jgi:hypothetical protein
MSSPAQIAIREHNSTNEPILHLTHYLYVAITLSDGPKERFLRGTSESEDDRLFGQLAASSPDEISPVRSKPLNERNGLLPSVNINFRLARHLGAIQILDLSSVIYRSLNFF